jgi:hypothetical protein
MFKFIFGKAKIKGEIYKTVMVCHGKAAYWIKIPTLTFDTTEILMLRPLKMLLTATELKLTQ